MSRSRPSCPEASAKRAWCHEKCPYCGATNEVPKSPDTIQELDYLTYVHHLPEGEGVHDTITIKCTKCAAETTLPPNVTASLCPFCGNGIVATASTKKAIRPKGVLPFHVTHNQASDLFRTWVIGLWIAPNAIKRDAERSAIRGAYIPAWTYDTNTESDYTGEVVERISE